MKKIIIALMVSACLTIGICTPAYAENIIVGTAEANEILEPDKELILEDLQKYKYFDENTDSSVILYDRAIATCLSADIFSMEKINNETMLEYMKQAKIGYDIPVKCDQSNIFLSIAKGAPVTEEEKTVYSQKDIEFYEKMAGRWNINGIEEWNFKFDYIEHINQLLEKNDISESNVYLVGGIAANLEFVAVICRENEDTKFLILNGWDTNSHHIGYQNPSSKLYTYDELKSFAQIWGPEYENYVGSGAAAANNISSNNNYIRYALLSGGSVLAAGAAALIINFALKKKHKTAE